MHLIIKNSYFNWSYLFKEKLISKNHPIKMMIILTTAWGFFVCFMVNHSSMIVSEYLPSITSQLRLSEAKCSKNKKKSTWQVFKWWGLIGKNTCFLKSFSNKLRTEEGLLLLVCLGLYQVHGVKLVLFPHCFSYKILQSCNLSYILFSRISSESDSSLITWLPWEVFAPINFE